MAITLTQKDACIATVSQATWGGGMLDRIPVDSRPDVLRTAEDEDLGPDDVIRRIADQGEAMQRRIAVLEATLSIALTELTFVIDDDDETDMDVVVVRDMIERVLGE